MLENNARTDYNWLIMMLVIASTAMIDAGFDNDIPLFMSILLVCTMIINIAINRKNLIIDKTAISFGLYVTWAGLSIIWSVTPVRTVIETLHLILFLLVYLFIQFISAEGRDKLVRIIFIVAAILAFLGMFEYIFLTGNRIQSTFTNANPFAIFMTMFFLLVMSMALRSNNKILYVLAGIYAVAVFLSGSRAALLAMFVAGFIIFLQISRENMPRAILSVVVVLVISLALSQGIVYLSRFVTDRVDLGQTVLDQLIRKDTLMSVSVKGRLEFWRVAAELFTNRPLTGYGQGAYYSAYYLEYGMNQWYSRFAHNNFLQILSETGIIGLLLFLLFLWNMAKSVIQQFRSTEKPNWFWGMTAGATAFLIHNCVDFTWNFPAVTVLFFVFISMISHMSLEQSLAEDQRTCKTWKIKRGLVIPLLIVFLMLNSWQLTSIQLLKSAVEREQNQSIESTLELAEIANRIYQVSSYGWSYESDLHYKLYEKSGDENELKFAIDAASTAVKREPYNDTYNIDLGLLYKQAGDYDLAEKYLQYAVKYSAHHLNAQIELSTLYLEQGENSAAIESLTAAADKSALAISMAGSEVEKEILIDTTARIYLTLAGLHQEAGNSDAAQEQLNHLNKLASEYENVQKYLQQEIS
jgi:O-antigen ligase